MLQWILAASIDDLNGALENSIVPLEPRYREWVQIALDRKLQGIRTGRK